MLTVDEIYAWIDSWLRIYRDTNPDDERSDLDILLSAEYQDDEKRARYAPEEIEG